MSAKGLPASGTPAHLLLPGGCPKLALLLQVLPLLSEVADHSLRTRLNLLSLLLRIHPRSIGGIKKEENSDTGMPQKKQN